MDVQTLQIDPESNEIRKEKSELYYIQGQVCLRNYKIPCEAVLIGTGDRSAKLRLVAPTRALRFRDTGELPFSMI